MSEPLAVGTKLYLVYDFAGRLEVESDEIVKITPQRVWLKKRGRVSRWRSCIDRTEAELLSRSPLEAAEKWLSVCAEKVSRAQTDMAKAVALLETV